MIPRNVFVVSNLIKFRFKGYIELCAKMVCMTQKKYDYKLFKIFNIPCTMDYRSDRQEYLKEYGQRFMTLYRRQ